MVTKIAKAKTKESSAGYAAVALDEKDSDM